MEILVGCDPEVFVKQGGVFKSAFGLIQGDKANPQKVNPTTEQTRSLTSLMLLLFHCH